MLIFTLNYLQLEVIPTFLKKEQNEKRLMRILYVLKAKEMETLLIQHHANDFTKYKTFCINYSS